MTKDEVHTTSPSEGFVVASVHPPGFNPQILSCTLACNDYLELSQSYSDTATKHPYIKSQLSIVERGVSQQTFPTLPCDMKPCIVLFAHSGLTYSTWGLLYISAVHNGSQWLVQAATSRRAPPRAQCG